MNVGRNALFAKISVWEMIIFFVYICSIVNWFGHAIQKQVVSSHVFYSMYLYYGEFLTYCSRNFFLIICMVDSEIRNIGMLFISIIAEWWIFLIEMFWNIDIFSIHWYLCTICSQFKLSKTDLIVAQHETLQSWQNDEPSFCVSIWVNVNACIFSIWSYGKATYNNNVGHA